MASFPTSVKSFSARTSGETIAASHINDLQDEVAAIEADLLSATPTYITKATTGVNASALSTGTLPIARLDANVLLTTSTTGINASALSTGTVPDARLSGTYTLITANNATFAFGKSEGALNVNSATTATTANNSTYAFGKSEGALNVNSAATATQTTNATNLNSQPGSYYTNASNLATGTLAIARLDANVILTTSTTGMNASAVSTGTLPDARLSSNVALLNATNVFTASAAFPLTLQPSTATSYAVMAMTNTGGSGYIGQNGSTAGAFLVDGTAYALFMRAPSGVPIEFGSGTTKNMSLSSAGLLTVSGFGFSAFDADGNGPNGLDVRNDTTGTAAGSMLRLWSDSNDSLTVSSFSTSHSTHAGKSRINQNTAAGLDILASHASGDVRLYSRNALALTLGASQLATFTGDLSIQATKKLYLDGGSNTYIYEPSGDKIHLIANSVVGLNVQENYIAIPATNKFYLDGSNGTGSDTYITEGVSDQIYMYTGGTLGFVLNNNNLRAYARNLLVDSTYKLYFDGGSDTYITESAANQVDMYAGGSIVARMVPTYVYFPTGDLLIAPTKKLYFDAGSDTYMYESSANQITSVTGGSVRFRVDNAYTWTVGANAIMDATYKLYLDGGYDTYLYESTGNQFTFVVGGVEGINITSAGIWKTTWSTTASAANAFVGDGNYLLRSTSSIRYKHDIDTLDADHALSAVMAMRPVTYRGKTDEDQRRHVGFIAEEMQTIAPLLATYDEGGETGTPNYVTYDRVTAYLVAVVQKQQAEIDALKAQIKG